MLDRVKSPILALGLLSVLPVSSVRSTMLDRVKNPVLALELSKRYKNRAYIANQIVVHTFFFLCLCGSMLLGFLFYFDDYHMPNLLPNTILNGMIMFFVVCRVFFVVPVLAATSVVDERRSQTLELVQLTLLRPFDIVWGKFAASIAPVLLPVGVFGFAWVFHLLPFVAIEEDWLTVAVAELAVIAATALACSATLVLVSTFAKSRAASIAASYVIALIFCSLIIFLIDIPMIEILSDNSGSLTYQPSSDSYRIVLPGSGLGDNPIAGLAYHALLAAVFTCVAGLSVWWTCRRLRLPTKKGFECVYSG